MGSVVTEAFFAAISWPNIIYSFGAVFFGVLMGAMPGISGTLTLALLIPITFGLPSASALIILTASYCGAIFGGSITAILINTPGTGGSAATCLDGYPMAQKGQANTALGIAASASFIGGMVGVLAFALFAPPLSRLTMLFHSPEYFALALFGLSIVAVTSKNAMRKGLIGAGLGLLFSTVGYSPLTGFIRFNFGITYLEDGIPLIQAMIGIFAISQAFILAEQKGASISEGKIIGTVMKGILIPFKYPITLIRSILLGIGFGALPGVGTATANFVAYMTANRYSKHPETFGEGNPEGVVAPEAANNALVGGALVPTLTFGIPGNAATALLLGALMIHGLQIGPALFTTHAIITYTMVWGLIFAQIFMLIIAILGANIFAKVTLIAKELLIPIIIILSLIGSYAIRSSVGDIFLAVVFGFIGYFLKKAGYPTISIILGLVLGQIAEINFQRSLMISDGSMLVFFARPISGVIMAIIAISLISPTVKAKLTERKKRKG